MEVSGIRIPSNKTIAAVVVVLVLSAVAWFLVPKSKVLVEVSQPGFILTIDGKTQNISSGDTIQLRSGSHIYSITKYGFTPKGGVFESKDFNTSSIKADLVAIPIIELEYKDFYKSFGTNAEVLEELKPKDGWIVATILLEPELDTKKLVVFKKTNDSWAIVVEGGEYNTQEGGSYITPRQQATLPPEIALWLRSNNFTRDVPSINFYGD
jgi:hypothetical protein